MLSNELASEKLGFDLSSVEQGSQEWLLSRLGVITASMVGNILTEPRSKKGKELGEMSDSASSYMHQLIAEICTGKIPDEINARPLRWGKENEEAARIIFEFENDEVVTSVPFIYKDESMRCGISPDGLCSSGRGLELKCPYTSAQYIKFLIGGADAVKSEYMAQVQYSMWITGYTEWYFSNFDPRLKRDNIHTIIISRDNEMMDLFDEKIPSFINKMDTALELIGFEFGSQWVRE